MRGWWSARRGWRPAGVRCGGRRHPPAALALALAVAAAVVGLRLLAAVFAMFQRAYLDAQWLVLGSRVAATYWQAVRFAFGVTVLVSVGLGLLAALIAVELARAVRR